MTRTLFYLLRSFFVILWVMWGNLGQAQYCTVGFSSGVQPMTLVDFAGINNSTPATGGTAYEDFTAISGNAIQGQSYTLTVKGNTFGNYSDYYRVFFDWNQDNDFLDAGEDFNAGIIINSTGTDAIQATTSILIPFSSNLGSIRMRVAKKYNAYVSSSCNTTGWGQAEDYVVNVTSGSSCGGTPAAGTATIPAAVCPNTAFTLSLTGYTSASGITIQWEEEVGSGWQQITNATNATYTVSTGINTPTSYRAVVSCGTLHDTSNTGLVAVNALTQCYCTISYPLSGGGPISLVNFGSINNATSAATGGPSYQDFRALSETVQQGQSVMITVKGNTVGNYTDSVRVFFDWDQNGSFADPGESFDVGPLTNTTGLDAVQVSTAIVIPFSATLGATAMRVTKKYAAYSGPCNSAGYGQAEDYTINIVNSNSCIGKPNSGTASAPAAVCTNTGFNLTLTGYSVDAGIYLQWQFYNTATTAWEDIPGASTAVYAIPGITAATDYRAVVTCSNSTLTDTSNQVTVAVAPFINCYCTPATSGGFGITHLQIANTTFNNPSTGGTAPGYTAYPATGSTTATLMEGAGYYVSATFTAQAFAGFWIDYDQDGIFSPSEYTAMNTANASGNISFTVPVGALAGQTKMRMRSRGGSTTISSSDACSTFGSGETEDYIVTIVAAAYCSGTPLAGVLTAPSGVCPGVGFSMSVTGYTVAPDVTLQWEENYGSGWQQIPSATNPVYTLPTGITTPTSYRVVVTCAGSALSATTLVAAISVNAANQCYCNISFPAGDVEPITLVDFAGINQASSNTIGAPPQWEDYTSVTGSVNQGQSYTINVKGNTNGNYTDVINVYIDWDQNGLFTDPGENFSLGNLTNSTGLDAVIATTSIAVPSNATIGMTRMRVTKKWSAAAGPCNTAGYGQAEDYSLLVDFPLTVQLAGIEAMNMGDRNRVDWVTASEEKDDAFELERSADGKAFETVYLKKANGSASVYSYLDEAPFSGNTYYRLKMKHTDGSSTYSRIVVATRLQDDAADLEVFPNPVTDKVSVHIRGGVADDAFLTVTDIFGKLIHTLPAPGQTCTISFREMANGIYFIRYSDRKSSRAVKVTKQ